jgi:hypothetical protein
MEGGLPSASLHRQIGRHNKQFGSSGGTVDAPRQHCLRFFETTVRDQRSGAFEQCLSVT